MAARGRIYRRGLNYYIAYRWDGREYRESARSTDVGVAERLLATRVAERRGHGHAGVLTFDDLVAWYLDDYEVRRLRTLNTARGRDGEPGNVGVEPDAAPGRAERGLAQRPVFPERLEERGPRQGFFEHADYLAVRGHLPPAYQDVLDFACYSGWRKREILELRWSEVDEPGGVVRLSPERSKTRVGRVLPIVAPIAAVLACAASGRGPLGVSARRGHRAGMAHGVAGGVSAGGRAGPVAPRLPPHGRAELGTGRGS